MKEDMDPIRVFGVDHNGEDIAFELELDTGARKQFEEEADELGISFEERVLDFAINAQKSVQNRIAEIQDTAPFN